MTIDSPIAVLYNADGQPLAVSQSQDVSGVLQPGLVIVGSGSDGKAHFFKVTTDGALHITGSILTTTRKLTGSYFCSSEMINGSTSSQILITITNPVNSGRTIFIKRTIVQGIAIDVATLPFLYHLGRTTDTPISGTTLFVQRHSAQDAVAVAVVRQGATTTLASGSMWVGAPGIFTLQSGFQGEMRPSLDVVDELNDIVLAQSESLAFSVDANTVDWRHYGQFFWHEV